MNELGNDRCAVDPVGGVELEAGEEVHNRGFEFETHLVPASDVGTCRLDETQDLRWSTGSSRSSHPTSRRRWGLSLSERV